MLWSGLPTPEMYKRTKLLPVYVRYGALVRRSESEPTFQRNLRIPSKFEGLIKMAKKKRAGNWSRCGNGSTLGAAGRMG